MSEIKLNAEALEEAGAALGFTFAALIRGFQAGMDAYDVMLEETAIREIRKTEEERERSVKTEIGDCRKCWCDQCARLEECEKIREGFTKDGLRRLIIPKNGGNEEMKYKVCDHCGAHLDNGETCDCRNTNNDGGEPKDKQKERKNDNDGN